MKIIRIILYITFLPIILSGLISCSSKKNTSANRFLHSFNTRYNVYFNANENYKKALTSLNDGYKDNYTDFLPMYPVSNVYKDKEKLLETEEKRIASQTTPDVIKNQTTASKGSWDYTIEKCQKAIKLHSITQKPPRKGGKKKDDAYREYQSRGEYNPFLHHAWMLMGKSQFYKGQFLTASSTFNYISRSYAWNKDLAAEANIWSARCYQELGWLYEAEDILNKINNDALPQSQNGWFSSINADYLLKQQKYREAIPFLITAVKHAETKTQKARMTFLLGQLYMETDENEKAYAAFGKVPGMNPPYELEFNARIKQSEVYPGNNPSKMLKMLNGMTKNSKNEDYLDRIYYAMGNIRLAHGDTINAIADYKKGMEKSTQNGPEKAVLAIKLGDLYYSRGQYVEAQPCFSEAISIIQKGHKDYERVAKLSETMDELVDYFKEVQLQDSLQYLARLPEDERIAVIEKIIADLEKKEKEEKETAEREKRLEENQSMRPEIGGGGAGNISPDMGGGFYFYNTTALSNGRTEFQRKWGRRKLEDDWRRKDKTATYDNFASTENPDDKQGALNPDAPANEENETNAPAKSTDKKDVNYYLQQIPLLPEQLEQSNALIADGLFNMGLIYKNKLGDYSISIATFNQLEERFPENEYRLETYYNMFLMYLKMRDLEQVDVYKNKLIAAYPESDYAAAIADPNFEYKIQMMAQMQDSLYEATYNAYLNEDINTVHLNYALAKKDFPLSKLMPKFMFLDALTYASTGDAETFKNTLKDIIDKYPESDVNQLAGEMLKGMARGRQPARDGQTRGMLWNMRLGIDGEEISFSENDSISNVFNADPNVPYLMAIIYPTGNVNTNELLFMVAGYNFANILTKNFDLETFSFNDISMVLVKNFVNLEEVSQYYRLFLSNEDIKESLKDTQPILISESNFNQLIAGHSIGQYLDFYDLNFGKQAPVKINQRLSEKEIFPEEETSPKELSTPNPDAPEESSDTDMPESPEIDNEQMIISILGPNASKDTEEVNTVSQINQDIEDVFNVIEDQKENISRIAKQKWDELLHGKPELTEEEKAEDKRIAEIRKKEKAEEKALKKQAQEQAKAEKIAQLKKEREDKKIEQSRIKAEKNAQKAAEKAEKDAKTAADKEKAAIKKEAEKAKEDAKKAAEQKRKDALKEQKRKAAEKEKERKAKEKERQERLKQKERKGKI